MVTQFEVKVAEGADPTAVARAIDTAFHADRVQTDMRGKGVFEDFAVGDLGEMVGFANYLGYACVILVLTLVSTTTMMAVQDRVQNIRLQTLGLTSLRIFGLVLIESMILSIAGGLVGVGARWPCCNGVAGRCHGRHQHYLCRLAGAGCTRVRSVADRGNAGRLHASHAGSPSGHCDFASRRMTQGPGYGVLESRIQHGTSLRDEVSDRTVRGRFTEEVALSPRRGSFMEGLKTPASICCRLAGSLSWHNTQGCAHSQAQLRPRRRALRYLSRSRQPSQSPQRECSLRQEPTSRLPRRSGWYRRSSLNRRRRFSPRQEPGSWHPRK